MKIAVYCGSSAGNKPVYMQCARELGEKIGEAGDDLVYGGSNTGLMGAVADGVLAKGGHVTGVVPEIPSIACRQHPHLTEAIAVKTMSERKDIMLELADGYIVLPGGPGTLDELSDLLALARLSINQKPCAIVNLESYYDCLKYQLSKMVECGFANKSDFNKVLFSDNLDEILKFMHR